MKYFEVMPDYFDGKLRFEANMTIFISKYDWILSESYFKNEFLRL